MAGNFGDADSVRRLGQALLTAGREVAATASSLSGQVKSLVPSGWSGNAAEAFSSDWNGKAGRAAQLAAACTYVGQALVDLAGELKAARQEATAAEQMTGGPVGVRFDAPGSEQKSKRMLGQATGAAELARAAARAKLAGIAVPRIGPPLTARQVEAWAGQVAPPSSAPGFDHLLHEAGKLARGLVLPGGRDGQRGRHGLIAGLVDRWLADARGFARRSGLAASWGHLEHLGAGPLTVGAWAHFQEGGLDGLLGLGRGLVDLVPGPDGGMGRWLLGDPSAGQAWQGLSHLAPVYDPVLAAVEPHAAAQAWKEFGNSFLALDEWHKDPARAAGNAAFNIASILLPTKVLALRGDSVAADTGETGEDAAAVERGTPAGDVDPTPPGPPPKSFGRPLVDGSADRPELPTEVRQQVGYQILRTSTGEPVPLFDGAPAPEQAIQRSVDDCGLVTALRALARYRPEMLQDSIQETPDGSVIMRLHEVKLSDVEAVPTGRTIELRVSGELPTWKGSDTAWGVPVSNTSWAAIAEKALAAIDRTWTAERIKFNNDLWRAFASERGIRDERDVDAFVDARGYARLNRGFFPQEITELMAQLSGDRAGTVALTSPEDAESTLTRLLRERKPVMAQSRPEEEMDPDAHGVFGDHWYEVTGIEDGKVIMKNPWGRADPAPVPTAEFLKEFYKSVVTVG